MASLVLKMSVSLDGFVAPIDGSTDWVAAGRSDAGASWTVETLSKSVRPSHAQLSAMPHDLDLTHSACLPMGA